MTWRSLGHYILNKSWQYTNPVQGEIFRVKSSLILANQYLKGAISSIVIDDDGEINLFDSKRLSYRIEPEIFTFYFPIGLGDQRIGIKRLDDTKVIWSVELQVLETTDTEFDRFLTQFGDRILSFMALYQRGTAFSSRNINSGVVDCPANESKKLLDLNSKRRSLTLMNGSSNALICGKVEQNGTPVDTILTLLANETYEFPSDGNGIYMGEVYVKAFGAPVKIAFTEFNSAI